jgi:hypothetical protein
METQKFKKAIAQIGLVGLLALGSGCGQRVQFIDGTDQVQVTHAGLSNKSCDGTIRIRVIKSDGNVIIYNGGRASPYEGVEPRLDSFRIINKSQGKDIFVTGEFNQNAYRNFTNYIGRVERNYREEIDTALNETWRGK